MMAYCGLNCSKCDAYLATKENCDTKRQATAQKWSQMFQSDIKPEQINCSGCKSDAEKFFHCNECEIRQCCIERDIEHCAACEKYICDRLADFIKYAPEAASELDRLRKHFFC